MFLQQLIGELQTLALAYPPETPILAEWRGMNLSDVVGVTVQSDDAGVRVVIEAQ